MQRAVWVVMIAATACGGGGAATPDAEVDAATMCAPRTAPLAPGAHQLFLNFEGVTLTKGVNNSASNIASVLVNDPTTVPAYQPTLSAGLRQEHIDLIRQYVQDALAPYSLDVVTTRPATGAYMMNVIGGRPEDMGFVAGTGSIAGQACRTEYAGVALEFDIDTGTVIDTVNSILSDITVMVGMGLSTEHNDCANRSAAIDPGVVCSFSAMAPTNATASCGHTPTQDEPRMLLEAFDCRD